MDRDFLDPSLPGDLEALHRPVGDAQPAGEFALGVVGLGVVLGSVTEAEEAQSRVTKVRDVHEDVHGPVEDAVAFVLADVVLVDLLRLAQRHVVALIDRRKPEQPKRGKHAGDLVVADVVGDDVLEPTVAVEQQQHGQEAVGIAFVRIGEDLRQRHDTEPGPRRRREQTRGERDQPTDASHRRNLTDRA